MEKIRLFRQASCLFAVGECWADVLRSNLRKRVIARRLLCTYYDYLNKSLQFSVIASPSNALNVVKLTSSQPKTA